MKELVKLLLSLRPEEEIRICRDTDDAETIVKVIDDVKLKKITLEITDIGMTDNDGMILVERLGKALSKLREVKDATTD